MTDNHDILKDRRTARVSASVLHRLAPFLAKHEECFFRRHGGQNLWGWRVEPCVQGGVIVIATNGVVIGVMRDREGAASEPVTIMASKGLLKAVKPPKKVRVFYPGDWDEVDLPADFQPGDVVAMAMFVAVYDQGIDKREPDEPGGEHYSLYTESAEDGKVYAGGYRLESGFVPWRAAIERWVEDDVQPCHSRMNPGQFNAFRRIGKGVLDLFAPADELKPVLVTSIDEPDFVGAIMRGDPSKRPARPPVLPDWLAATPPALQKEDSSHVG